MSTARMPTWDVESTPEPYKAAVENAAATANVRTMAKYDVLIDLQKVKEFAEIRQFPDEVLAAFKEETEPLA